MRIVTLFAAILLLSGCAGANGEMQRALGLRETLLAAEGCTFQATVTADYGDQVYTFTMLCSADKNGDMTFSVITPESISGVSGRITQSGGRLTFDDTALAFSPLAEGEISPVTAPWLFLRTLRSGYIRACGKDGDSLQVTVDDSYEADALQLDIWLSSADVPQRAQVLWHGRRVLSLGIENFDFV